jgi:hypothetical protein
MIELTPELLNGLLDNILDYREKVEVQQEKQGAELKGLSFGLILKQTLGFVKDANQTWHIQEKAGKYYLWRRTAWLKDVEYRAQVEKSRELYNTVLEERKDMYYKIASGICELLGLGIECIDLPHVKKLTQVALSKKSKNVGELLGIELTNLRELPAPHYIMDEDITL